MCYRRDVTAADLRMLSEFVRSVLSWLGSVGVVNAAVSSEGVKLSASFEGVKLLRNLSAGVYENQLHLM